MQQCTSPLNDGASATSCGLAICPFCYARYCIDVWCRVSACLTAEPRGLTLRTTDSYVADARLVVKSQLLRFTPTGLDSVAWLQSILEKTAKQPCLTMASLSAYAGLVVSHVYANRGMWCFSRRELYVTPAMVTLPTNSDGASRVLRPTSVAAMVAAVAKTLRYPPSLLFCAADEAKAVVAARKGRRLSAVYGVFRRRKKGMLWRLN